ncbi:hypothetical protein D3C84_939630 [compost metagenome]
MALKRCRVRAVLRTMRAESAAISAETALALLLPSALRSESWVSSLSYSFSCRLTAWATGRVREAIMR